MLFFFLIVASVFEFALKHDAMLRFSIKKISKHNRSKHTMIIILKLVFVCITDFGIYSDVVNNKYLKLISISDIIHYLNNSFMGMKTEGKENF